MENKSLPNKTKSSKAKWQKNTATFSRWLHIYLSMTSFIIVLFFAVTGFTVNHADWFVGMEKATTIEGNVQLNWVAVGDTAAVAKFEVVEFLKHNYHVSGEVSEFIIEPKECIIYFKGPGYSADAFINRSDGTFQISETRMGLVAIMNDLHKGRDAGKGWSVLIDVSAILLTLISLTGIVMIFFMKKKRASGILVLVLGGIVCYIFYVLLVP